MTAQTQPVGTLFMSISLNGMIARPDGSEDFFTDINWHAFVDLAQDAGAVAWGRETHEIFRRQAVADMPDVRGFVLTSNRAFQVEKGWTLATSPEETITLATQADAKELLVVGGAKVNAAFARGHLIVRVVLKHRMRSYRERHSFVRVIGL
jgi:dihydrofolate reductase